MKLIRKIATRVLLLILIALAVIWSILVGYSVEWTGFGDFTTPSGEFIRGKTLWDWFQLLVIPLSLFIGGYLLNSSERALERQIAEDRAKLEREIATDRQQEAALQAYLDKMAELLLKENLRTTENEEVRHVARTLTLTILRGLSPRRKGNVIIFLYEAKLINRGETTISLMDSDLSGANLANANLAFGSLIGADLTSAILTGANLANAYLLCANLAYANLEGTNLTGAVLTGTNLASADLENANLTGTNLTGAILKDVKVNDEQLTKAKSLEDTTMPDGTKHE